MITGTQAIYLSMHHNGHVKNQSKNSTRRISTVICTVCTVGTRHWSTTARENTVDELNLGHLQVKELLELLQDHRDVYNRRAALGRRTPRPAAPPPPAPSGNPLWGSRAPPQTDGVALYGLGSPRGRGSPFPEGRERSTVQSSRQLLRRECHPSSDRLAAPAGCCQ